MAITVGITRVFIGSSGEENKDAEENCELTDHFWQSFKGANCLIGQLNRLLLKCLINLYF